jgi:large subunit ribosomal protein L17
MRHGVKGFKLGRTASHKKATLRILATALLKHKKIRTTITKAKATRLFVEPIITKAKIDTVHSRRIVAADIQDRTVLQELFGEIANKVANRNGGYTRIVKLGTRPGDASEMAYIELVDYNLGTQVSEKPKKQKAELKATPVVVDKKTEEVVEAEVIEESAQVEETEVTHEVESTEETTSTEDTKEN